MQHEKKLEEAIRCYRTAIEINPKLAVAHRCLGAFLCDEKSDYDGAINCFQQALALEGETAMLDYYLGNAWIGKGDLQQAINCYLSSIRLNSKLTYAHFGLGVAFFKNRQPGEAIRCYRDALALDANYAEAHCNLGLALRDAGRFTEALDCLKRGHELGSQRNDWRDPSDQWIAQCERLIELDPKLHAFLNGEAQPASATERLYLASLCQLPCKRLHAAAVRFFAEAIGEDPKFAEDPGYQLRYSAACSAALSAAGQTADATDLDDRSRTGLRKQALDWLRADLAAWTKLADDAKEHSHIRQALQHWQHDPDLAGIRDPAAVAKLLADEQEVCKKLWADVAELLKKVEGKK
jgi:tetratricopeptide (TPR) repeat protein